MHKMRGGMLLICALTIVWAGCEDEAGTGGIIPEFDTAGFPDVGGGDTGFDTGAGDTGSSDTGIGDIDTTTPCDSDAVCTHPGEICVYEIDTASGTVETVCRLPIGPNGDGEGCANDADCERGLCVDGLCVAPCGGNADCPGSLICATADVDIPPTVTVPACVPRPCTSRVDCTDPETCVVDRSGTALELACGDPVGNGGQGDGCSTDADCGANLCVDGECVEPCQRNNDCSTDGSVVCASTDITLGGGGLATVPLCQPAPPQSCSSDSQCTTAGDRCVASKSATDLTFSCGSPNPGGSETGGACNDDSECAQNLCVSGTCAGPCQVDGDCGVALYDCTLTNVDLGGGNTDDANICVPPVFCDEDDDCVSGSEICYVRRDLRADTGTPTLTLTCEPDNVRRDTGEACTDDADCSANLCFADRFGSICTQPCVDNSDCPTGHVCSTEDILASDGTTTVPTGVCVEAEPPACSQQSDCAALAGTTCAVVESADGTGLESVCYTFPGANNSQPCNADGDCKSQVCLSGFCADLCDGSNPLSCAGGQVCLNDQNHSRNGLSGTFDLCEVIPDVVCSNTPGGTPHCTAEDGIALRVCGGLRQNAGGTALETFCVMPNAGQSSFGSTCAPGNGSTCEDNVCSRGSEECSVYCTEDSNCDVYRTGSETIRCTGYGFNPGPTYVGHCMYGCTDDDDCTGLGNNNKVCTTSTFQTAAGPWDVDTVCEVPAGSDDLGAPCNTGSECISGLCLTTYNGTSCSSDANCTDPDFPVCRPRGAGNECSTRGCTRLCDPSDNGGNTSADCQNGAPGNELTECSNSITFGLPDGQTRTISACARP